MTAPQPAPFEIYLVATPGLEAPLCAEALEAGFAGARVVEGGVAVMGQWADVMRANLVLRGATRVLMRLASFPAIHLSQLDKKARKLPWGEWLRPDVPVRVEASCKASRIYHSGAAAERVAKAIAAILGAPLSDAADLRLLVRIEKNLVTLSADTTGDSLHKRGFKEGVARAPMRETMAALFLRQCGYSGGEPVLDPMCGSGTFVIEAAEIAMGLLPGRARDFAFQQMQGFSPAAWENLKSAAAPRAPASRFFGSDRDPGAIRMAAENAERSGVSAVTTFTQTPIADLQRPEGPPGLVIVNPPYGQRIGNKAPLLALHRTLGEVLRTRFAGWRVGLITADPALAKATGLEFAKPEPSVLHGGIRVEVFRTGVLG